MARTNKSGSDSNPLRKPKGTTGGLIKNLALGKPAKPQKSPARVPNGRSVSAPISANPAPAAKPIAAVSAPKPNALPRKRASQKPSKSAPIEIEHDSDDQFSPKRSKASDKTRRQMRLLLLLIGAGHAGADILEIFKIDEYWRDDTPESKRDPLDRKGRYDTGSSHAVKLQRDIRDLQSIGLKIVDATQAANERKRYRLDMESCFRGNITLEEEEQLLLHRLCEEASTVFPAALAQSLRVAVYKLSLGFMEPPSLRDSGKPQLRQAAPATRTSGRAADQIVEAMAGGHPVRFKYRGSNDQSSRQRHVAPFSLLTRGRNAYLIGRDLQDSNRSIKAFRLNRIDGNPTVDSNTKGYFPPPDFDPAKYLSPDPVTTTIGRALVTVTIDFDAEVGFIISNWADGRNGATVKELKNGGVRLTINQASPSGLVAMLAEYAGHFSIREPEAAQALSRLMEETLKPYRA